MNLTQGRALDPCGNTGSYGQTVSSGYDIRIDWLNATGKFPTREHVIRCIEDVAYMWGEDGCIIWTEERGVKKGRWYNHTASTPHGAMFAWHQESDGNWSLWVSLPARVLARMPGLITWKNCCKLNQVYGLSPSRLDVALDDFTKSVSFEQVRDAADAGNYSHFRNHDVIYGRKGGFTVYFGSRQSEVFGRFYNKSVESKGAIDSHRFEIEFKDGSAKNIWLCYTQCNPSSSETREQFYESVCELLKECVVGSFKFIDRTVSERADRCPLLPWWESFVSFIRSTGGIRFGSMRRESRIQDKVNWMKKQVATSLAMIRESLGESFSEFLSDLIQSGEERYTSEHHRILKLHKMRYDSLNL